MRLTKEITYREKKKMGSYIYELEEENEGENGPAN